MGSRERADGGVTIQIKWRMDGRWQSESFTSPRSAAEFRAAVEDAGDRWPEGWVKGHGWAPTSVQPRPVPDPPAEAETVTFADVAHGEKGYFAWQARRAKLGKLTPRTLHGYRRVYDLHLQEPFGPVAFEDIGIDDIADWIDTQIESGLSAKTIRGHHGLLSSIMKHGALRLKLRPENPCQVTELPNLTSATTQVRQMRFFQHEEWALFRSCLAPDFHLPLDLDLATGLRWGELTALRAGDISFTTAIDAGSGGRLPRANIHVVRAWSRRAPDDPAPIKQEDGEDRHWVLGPPKSKRARWVVVTGEVAERLQRSLKGRAPSDYVVTTREGRPWRYQNFHDRRWKPARDKAQQAGLTKRVTPHMLRHTTVVWLLTRRTPYRQPAATRRARRGPRHPVHVRARRRPHLPGQWQRETRRRGQRHVNHAVPHPRPGRHRVYSELVSVDAGPVDRWTGGRRRPRQPAAVRSSTACYFSSYPDDSSHIDEGRPLCLWTCLRPCWRRLNRGRCPTLSSSRVSVNPCPTPGTSSVRSPVTSVRGPVTSPTMRSRRRLKPSAASCCVLSPVTRSAVAWSGTSA